MIGLEPHLILRTKRANKVEKNQSSFGYVGNILFDRMVGATIHTCTPGEYGRVGSNALVEALCQDLEEMPRSQSSTRVDGAKKRVYKIPVGGSNGLGTWGYIEAVEELMLQIDGMDKEQTDNIDHVVFACGSGGSAAGIALGLTLAYCEKKRIEAMPKIHAIGVCDDPNYFYATIASIAEEMGLDLTTLPFVSEAISQDISMEDFVRNHMTVHQGKGMGYASSTPEELDFILKFAIETGIVLDPVYSGKAMYQFVQEMKMSPDTYRDSNIMFWHTGGSLGMFEKVEALSSQLEKVSPVKRMDVYGKKRSYRTDY